MSGIRRERIDVAPGRATTRPATVEPVPRSAGILAEERIEGPEAGGANHLAHGAAVGVAARPGTRALDQVAAAVVRAIVKDKGEIAVAPPELRLGARLGSLFPALNAAIPRRAGPADIVSAHTGDLQPSVRCRQCKGTASKRIYVPRGNLLRSGRSE